MFQAWRTHMWRTWAMILALPRPGGLKSLWLGSCPLWGASCMLRTWRRTRMRSPWTLFSTWVSILRAMGNYWQNIDVTEEWSGWTWSLWKWLWFHIEHGQDAYKTGESWSQRVTQAWAAGPGSNSYCVLRSPSDEGDLCSVCLIEWI